MNRTQSTLVLTGAVLLLAIGVAVGSWWSRRADAPDPAVATHAAPPQREVLYWYDPMVPDQHFDKPGKSPFMDMQLVPKYADEVGHTGVRIDPAVRQNLGVRTAEVEVARLTSGIRVPATLEWDLREAEVVSAPVPAIVSTLHVRAPYERVRRGQRLAALLAPQWRTAIAESQALDGADSTAARSLRSAAHERLRLLGLSGTSAGDDGAVVVHAPDEGVISELFVREGETVGAGAPLFRINGLDTLWLEAAIPQAGTAGIGPGTPVEATVSAVPGLTFEGEVETLLPRVDPENRTRRARIVLRNEGHLLAPGMFADVHLLSAAGEARPLVPDEAVIFDGQASRVIVLGEDGGFVPVPVRTGRSAEGRTEILHGLEGGEKVVVSGQFLIDSEASLSGALERLRPAGAPEVPMSEMDMGANSGHQSEPLAPASSFPGKRDKRSAVRPEDDPKGERSESSSASETLEAKTPDSRLPGNDEQEQKQEQPTAPEGDAP